MFKPASEPLLGLCMTENHIAVEWCGPARILFSMTQHGKALSCHFAAEKKALRYVKEAINSFCLWAFSEFEWCKMIIAIIGRPSVERIVSKCGFEQIATAENANIYMRLR